MLTPQGPASYYCAQTAALQNALIAHGYTSTPAKSIYELIRYQFGRSIVIIYNNHTVMIQGGDLETPRRLFAKLVEAEQQSLPF